MTVSHGEPVDAIVDSRLVRHRGPTSSVTGPCAVKPTDATRESLDQQPAAEHPCWVWPGAELRKLLKPRAELPGLLSLMPSSRSAEALGRAPPTRGDAFLSRGFQSLTDVNWP